MTELLPIILKIVQDGMGFLTEKQRTRFKDEHYKILKELENAKNTNDPDYTDVDLAITTNELRIFLEAYHSELRKNGLENVQQGN